MVAFQQNFIILLLLVLTICSCTSNFISLVESKFAGFSVNLIHRDSPKSPLYDPSLTHTQRVSNALRQSNNWSNSLSAYLRTGSRDLIPTKHGQFFAQISIGTPPVEMDAIIDTGSDLSWIQCKPCNNCYRKKIPIFDSKDSSTYKPVPCMSIICNSRLESSTCNYSSNACMYSVKYTDNTFSQGNLVTDTLRFGPVSFPEITFGCGHRNDLSGFGRGSGIIGFGPGSNSFIAQINQLINGKFSHCLVPFESENFGKLHFGENEMFSNDHLQEIISTPLETSSLMSTYHFVTLEGIIVEDEGVFVARDISQEGGNMFINTETTLTNLPLDYYYPVKSLIQKYVKLSPVDDPQGILSLCYNTLNFDHFPKIVFAFRATEGYRGDLRMRPANAFVQTGNNTMCLAFTPVENGEPAVLGNLAQMNMFVEYDLVKNTVSFKHTRCGRV